MAESDSVPKIISRQEAISRGLKYYFTGKPCDHGHVAERYARSRGCVQCSRDSKAQWRADHPDKALEYNQYYRRERKELAAASCKRWKNKNKQKAHNLRKAWVAANRDRTRASGRAWYKNNKNKEHVRERIRANTRNQRALRRARPGKHTPSDIADIFKAQRGRCAICRVKLGKKRHVDHIIPLSKDGNNDRRNLQVLCESCNCKKSNRDPIDFMRAQGALL